MKQIYQTLLQRYRFIAEKIMDEFAGFSSGIPRRSAGVKSTNIHNTYGRLDTLGVDLGQNTAKLSKPLTSAGRWTSCTIN